MAEEKAINWSLCVSVCVVWLQPSSSSLLRDNIEQPDLIVLTFISSAQHSAATVLKVYPEDEWNMCVGVEETKREQVIQNDARLSDLDAFHPLGTRGH